MRTKHLFAVSIGLFALFICLLSTAVQATTYTIQDVGTDGMLPNSTVTSLSDTGYVCGSCANIVTSVGFVWKDGVLTDLPLLDPYGTLPGYFPQCVNNSGDVVGTVEDEYEGSTAYLYHNGVISNLDFTGPGAPVALGINNSEQIVGASGWNLACVYLNGTPTALPLLPGSSTATATCINNSNPSEVAGYCESDSGYQATLWKNGVAYYLGALGGPSSKALGINDSGQIVGEADINRADPEGVGNIERAFLWTPTTPNGTVGTMQDLGIFGTDSESSSVAKSINNAGTVVGTSGSNLNTPVFIWTSATGMQYLSSMVVGNIVVKGVGTPDAWSLTTATSINNSGQIAGSFAFTPSQDGNETATSHGYVLTPSGGTVAPQISSLSFSPTSVVAGANSTGTVTLTSGAPAGGANIIVTTDGIDPQTLALAPNTISATYLQGTGYMTVGAHTMKAAYGGASASATLNITTNSALPHPISLAYVPATVAPGAVSQCSITLSAPAPAGGAAVSLIENSTLLGALGMTAGQTVGSFGYTANTTPGVYTESAVYNGVKVSTTLTVSSAPVTSLTSVSLNPASVVGGHSSTGTVKLSSAAPAAGAVVDLECDSANVMVSDTVTVLAGATSATFPVRTKSVTAATTATLIATLGSSSLTTSFIINPAPVTLKTLSVSPVSTIGGSITTGNKVLLTGVATATTIVTLSSSNTAVATVPASVSISKGFTSHTFPITALSVATPQTVTITAVCGGVTKQETLTVTPAAATFSIALIPTSVSGGSTSQGTVTLASAAPAGGVVVTLKSSSQSATVPSSVTVLAGSTTAIFTVSTTPVSSATTATITAMYGSSSQTAILTITAPTLSALTLSPPTVIGGTANATGTVTLGSPAPTGGSVVTLISGNTAALKIPVSVTVLAGATTATFVATSSAVASTSSVTVTATLGSASKTATETVNPAPTIVPISITSNPNPAFSSGQSVITVTLSAPASASGVSVAFTSNTSSLATVTVASGQSSCQLSLNWPAVTTATTVPISATANSTTVTTNVIVDPTTVTLSSLKFSPSTVKGGTSSVVIATLSAGAPAGGANVAVTYSGNPWYTIYIPAGQTSGSFSQLTATATANGTITFIGSYNGASKTAVLNVTP